MHICSHFVIFGSYWLKDLSTAKITLFVCIFTCTNYLKKQDKATSEYQVVCTTIDPSFFEKGNYLTKGQLDWMVGQFTIEV